MQRLRNLWLSLSSSLWFVPVLSVATAIGLAIGLTALDLRIGSDWIGTHTLVFGVGAEGARGMLAAIAGSMMTVASLTFSLTISTLATASSQYSSRMIRNFMRDRFNQFVLGYFVGLFAYCLVVLRAIRSGGDDGWQFVPSIAVMAGLVLALASIAVLILFIHHIASSIQAATILDRVSAETIHAIGHLFPDDVAEPAAGRAGVPGRALDDASGWLPVWSRRMGYVQHVDADTLVRLAAEADTVIRMAADVGAFVTPRGLVCEVALTGGRVDDALADAIRDAYSIGASRTIEQDPAFGVRQIVDIGLRALSPGVNDTTTGVMCVEHLAAILEAVSRRDLPDEFRAEDGTLRLVARSRSFASLLGLALDQIRQASADNVAVHVALAAALTVAARQTAAPDRRALLRRQGELLLERAEASLEFEDDKSRVRAALDALWLELSKLPPIPKADNAADHEGGAR